MTFQENLKAGMRQYLCTALDGTANLAGLYSRLFNPVTGDLLLQGRNFIRATLCDRPPEDLPEDPPFEGGQCLVTYRVTTRTRARLISNNSASFDYDLTRTTQPYIGRITGTRVDFEPPFIVPKVVHNSGNNAEGVDGLPDTVFKDVEVRIVSVSRIDNLPDNCGNPPSPIDPSPVPLPPQTIPIPYTDPNGVTVFIPVAFAAGFIYINADGEFNIPVTINVDGRLNLNGTFNFNGGDIRINIGGGGNGGSPGEGPGGGGDSGGPGGLDPGGEQPADPIDPPPPPPERDQPGKKILVGVLCNLSIDDPSSISTIFQEGSNPDIQVPNLGFVNFAYQVGTDISAWGSDIPIKNLFSVLFAENSLPCTDYGFTLRQGVTGRVIPLFKYTS